MPDLKSPILSLPYIAAAQAQKHVTHNEALAQLDLLVQLSVLAFDAVTPPGAPSEGDVYALGTNATGVWAAQVAGDLAAFVEGAWVFASPLEGWIAGDRAAAAARVWDGAAWQPLGGSVAPSSVATLGVNATADVVNRLSVSAVATLLNHEGAGHQLKLNKATAADTASLLFQTAFSGRAEMGTAGDDDFSIKVSPDGTTFFTALSVDGSTGAVALPNTPGLTGGREVLTTDRTYFVRTDGDDANDGLSDTAAGAFRTLQHAVDAALALDCGVYNVSVTVGAGAYGETVTIDGPILGSGTFTITGDTATPSSCSLNQFICRGGTIVALEGVELTGPDGVDASEGARVRLGNARFSGAGVAVAVQGAAVDAAGAALSFGATVTAISDLSDYGYLLAQGTSFNLDAGIDWGLEGALRLRSYSLAALQGASFAGTATGQRYAAALMSAIDTNGGGAAFIPGDAPGTVSTGSQYV